MDDVAVEKLFQQGVAAIRAGDKDTARDLLTQVVEQNQLHEQAWMWLSAAVTDKEEQILCLENVLTINPDNDTARRGIRKLKGLPEPASEPAAAPPTPAPVPQKPKDPENKWRERLKDTDYTSEATIVKPMHEGPTMGISDLANAWLWATIFQIPGSYQDEVDYGPVGHIAISVVAALVFQLLGLGAFAALIFSQPAIRANLFKDLPREATRGGALNIDRLLPVGLTLTTLLVVMFVVVVLVTLVALFFQAIVTNRVAEWMGGKGSVMGLLQSLAISLVPSALIMIPSLMALLYVPGGVGQVILWGGSLYGFLQTSNAVNASHRLGILASMGAVIISGVAMSGILCCLGYGVLMVLGPSAR